ncbi:MAG: bifunctional glutamate N-acetyltransferase/amino-acid acetyltransferase ArgJ [Lachnospiraceae bacterium]|nr:bifunctional glutamate N-acetyltransferase/amino-acid acetyltransferase ArgJ [Lachnospiraceae bacterium]
MEIIKGGVTAAKGYKAAAAEANIKYEGRTDMALLFSEVPAICAGTFTTNVVKAAPVVWDSGIVRGRAQARAVVVNSGIANACTGEEGMKYCRETAEYTAEKLGIKAEEVLVGSTGVIGMQLNADKLKAGIDKLVPALGSGIEKGTEANRAIMTTDTHTKEAAVQLDIGGKTVTIGGMCKGSGMIHPNMCTMLSFVTSDVAIKKELLQKAVSESIDDSFNMVSVDGDTSTNDTYIVLANGEAGNPVISEEGEEYRLFKEALDYVNTTLAKYMAGDGEGATALVISRVVGADSVKNARILAKSVITSSLTKAAIFGHDANWGRILCALGYSGVKFDPDRIELRIKSAAGELLIFKNGVQAEYSEEKASEILSQKEIEIISDVKMGDCSAEAYGCDLSYDYVRINADYRS